jgi:hypothetical protein
MTPSTSLRVLNFGMLYYQRKLALISMFGVVVLTNHFDFWWTDGELAFELEILLKE